MGSTSRKRHLTFLCPRTKRLMYPVHWDTVSHNEYCQLWGYYWNIWIIQSRGITLCLIPWYKCNLLSEVVCILLWGFVGLWSVPLPAVLYIYHLALLLLAPGLTSFSSDRFMTALSQIWLHTFEIKALFPPETARSPPSGQHRIGTKVLFGTLWSQMSFLTLYWIIVE